MTGQEWLNNHLKTLLTRCDRTGYPAPGRFLTGEECVLAVKAAKSAGLACTLDGGWPGAERKQVCIHQAGDEPEFTYEWLHVTWNARFASAEHRSLLGSLMGLGLDRSCFGDLVCREADAYLCVMPEISQHVIDSWTQAGHTDIRVSRCEEPPVLEAPKGKEKRDTVPSLRMDAVLSAAVGCSRAQAAEKIRAGCVQLNHVPEERCDRILQEGDLLSIRHEGRARLVSVGDKTRKDRLPIVLELFLHG